MTISCKIEPYIVLLTDAMIRDAYTALNDDRVRSFCIGISGLECRFSDFVNPMLGFAIKFIDESNRRVSIGLSDPNSREESVTLTICFYANVEEEYSFEDPTIYTAAYTVPFSVFLEFFDAIKSIFMS